MFWEREPFMWDDEEGRISRFISLGAFGGEPSPGKKQRVCYRKFSLFMSLMLFSGSTRFRYPRRHLLLPHLLDQTMRLKTLLLIMLPE
jgi:hypothetical protein